MRRLPENGPEQARRTCSRPPTSAPSHRKSAASKDSHPKPSFVGPSPAFVSGAHPSDVGPVFPASLFDLIRVQRWPVSRARWRVSQARALRGPAEHARSDTARKVGGAAATTPTPFWRSSSTRLLTSLTAISDSACITPRLLERCGPRWIGSRRLRMSGSPRMGSRMNRSPGPCDICAVSSRGRFSGKRRKCQISPTGPAFSQTRLVS